MGFFGVINGFFSSVGGSFGKSRGMSPIGLIYLCTKIFSFINGKKASKSKSKSKKESFAGALFAGGLIGVCKYAYSKWKP
jgi:hypothetical protein